MTSKELRQFIEDQGGDHSSILPILKSRGVLKIERIDTGQRGRSFVYSLK